MTARLEDFVAVRDLGAGLPDAAVERLLIEAESFGTVALADTSAIARQAAEAIRMGGGTVVTTDLPDAARSAGCQAILLAEPATQCEAEVRQAELHRWSGFPILLLVSEDGARVERGARSSD